MRSIEKKADSPVGSRKARALLTISHGCRIRYIRALKGSDWLSWTKAVARLTQEAKNRHNGTRRVTVTLLTPIRVTELLHGQFIIRSWGASHRPATHTNQKERKRGGMRRDRKGRRVRPEMMRNSYPQPCLGWTFGYTSTCVPLQSHRKNIKGLTAPRLYKRE